MPSSPEPEPTTAPRSRPAPRPALLAALVAVLAAAVFAPAVGGEYLLDDRTLILNNPFAHGLSHWTHWFSTDFWDAGNAFANMQARVVYYRPLVSASYAIDWALGGGSAVVFHLTNLVWYGATSALVFLALRRWLGSWRPALVAALLVAVHPTRAESVAWIAGRTDVMCATWMLLASCGIALRLRGRRAGIVLEVLATIASYLTKELAVVLPAFAAVEIWVAAGRPPLDARFVRTLLAKSAPQLAVAIAYLVARQFVFPITGLAGPPRALQNPWTHVGLVLETFGRAAGLIFFPRHLTIDQGPIRIHDHHFLYSTPYLILGAVALAGSAAIVLLARRRAPGVAVGTLFFLVAFLPTSNVALTQLTTVVSARFLFVPLLGVALAAGVAAQHAPRHWWRVMGGLAVAAGVALAASSVTRAQDFGDEHRFWSRAAALDPDSQTAAANQLRLAFGDRDNHKAFRLAVQAYALAQRDYAYLGDEAAFALQALDALAALTPDADSQRLRTLADFHAALADPARTSARLSLPELTLELDMSSPRARARLHEHEPVILVTRADLLSRLGDDAAAMALAKRATAECGLCAGVGVRAAIVLARGADYAAARRTSDELMQRLGGASAHAARESDRVGRPLAPARRGGRTAGTHRARQGAVTARSERAGLRGAGAARGGDRRRAGRGRGLRRARVARRPPRRRAARARAPHAARAHRRAGAQVVAGHGLGGAGARRRVGPTIDSSNAALRTKTTRAPRLVSQGPSRSTGKAGHVTRTIRWRPSRRYSARCCTPGPSFPPAPCRSGRTSRSCRRRSDRRSPAS